jgi:hypothetical protein
LDVPANRAFYEDAKRYIGIRRLLPDIFEQFPPNARQANIAKVDTKKNGIPNNLQAYGRFGNGRAALIVPNYGSNGPATFEITPPLAALGLDTDATYRITDLMAGKPLPSTVGFNAASFSVEIPEDHLGVYLLGKE